MPSHILQKKQIPVIESIRGLAAFGICMYHYIISTPDYVSNETIISIVKVGALGVPIFFMISGMVMPLSMIKANYKLKKWFPFLIKRMVRMEPPYFASIVLILVYFTVREAIPGMEAADRMPDTREVLLHLGYLVPFFDNANWISPVFWTLAVEFQYYLFIALMLPLALQPNRALKWLFYSCLIIAPLINPAKAFFLGWAAYFALGVFYTLWQTDKMKTLDFWIAQVLAAAVVWYTFGWDRVLAGGLTLLAIHYISDYSPKALHFLGKVSFSLYLTHILVGQGIINVLSHRFREPWEQVVVITFAFICTLAFAWLFWRMVEKPSHWLSRKIKLKTKV